VLRRLRPKRPILSSMDRLVLGWICRQFPNALKTLAIVRPETVLRWHRAGFRTYSRWKSRRRPGRPAVPIEIRQLIRKISIANPLSGGCSYGCVLDHPEIPLHTNGSENDVRCQVTRRKVSGGTRSDVGRDCRGKHMTLDAIFVLLRSLSGGGDQQR